MVLEIGQETRSPFKLKTGYKEDNSFSLIVKYVLKMIGLFLITSIQCCTARRWSGQQSRDK